MPVHLRCEYLENPLGLDTASPHLSWQSDNTDRNWRQAAYEILVASNNEGLRVGKADVWDSGKINSAESVGIAYGGPTLESRKRYYWKVRVWDAGGQVSESAEPAWWEMGLLRVTDWKAKWIHWQNPGDDADRNGIRWIWVKDQDALAVVPNTAVTFRTTVKLSAKPRDAVLLLAARGNFAAKVNGREVGAKKGWATFDRRDISDQLVEGKNVIEVRVTAPESPRFGPNAGAKTTVAALAALVKITRADGSTMRLPTGKHWETDVENRSRWQPAHVVADLTDKQFGDPGPLPQPAAYLRRTFAPSKNLQSARLYVTALGSYRVLLNGRRVGDEVLTPDFTDYRKRVLYQTYDVTNLLAGGKNQLPQIGQQGRGVRQCGHRLCRPGHCLWLHGTASFWLIAHDAASVNVRRFPTPSSRW